MTIYLIFWPSRLLFRLIEYQMMKLLLLSKGTAFKVMKPHGNVYFIEMGVMTVGWRWWRQRIQRPYPPQISSKRKLSRE